MMNLVRWTLACSLSFLVGCTIDYGDTWSTSSTGTAGTAGSGGEGGSGEKCVDDPADGAVLPECGIWVSVSKGDDAADGTQSAPVASLTRAIELAEQGPGRVYACNEEWTEIVVVPDTVSLHGSFDCQEDWRYIGTSPERSRLVPPSTIGLTWVDSSPEAEPFLTDFYIEAMDGMLPGESSYGMFIRDEGIPLNLRRCEIIAGNGADGLNGQNGDFDGVAPSGTHGNQGANACSALLSKGGAAPETACEGPGSKGGAGGDSGPAVAANGGNGEPAADPPAGQGGLGEAVSPGCTAGKNGAPGADGVNGLGGRRAGVTVTSEGFLAASGTDGTPGAPGQGGGGGGATFGSAAECGGASPGGAAGGSGGAGGCGGRPGKGGQAGGSSFGILTLSVFALNASRVEGRNGGKGGNGGSPQWGGQGGLPALGGSGKGSIASGCAGGFGGQGGRSGWGGGGAGGWTAGIMVKGNNVGSLDGDWELLNGSSGDGGSADIESPESQGESGNEGSLSIVLDPGD